MNREIKFRGERLSDGKLLYGSLVNNLFVNDATKEPILHILDNNIDYFDCYQDFDGIDSRVKNDTVSEYTGVLDKNGNEIYENDYVKSNYFQKGKVVLWQNGWHFEIDKYTHHSFNTAKHSFELL